MWQVSDIQARAVEASWSAPETEDDSTTPTGALSYEVSVSFSGKDGKYKSMYW